MNVLKEAKRNAKKKLCNAKANALSLATSELYNDAVKIRERENFLGHEEVALELEKTIRKIQKKIDKLRRKAE